MGKEMMRCVTKYINKERRYETLTFIKTNFCLGDVINLISKNINEINLEINNIIVDGSYSSNKKETFKSICYLIDKEFYAECKVDACELFLINKSIEGFDLSKKIIYKVKDTANISECEVVFYLFDDENYHIGLIYFGFNGYDLCLQNSFDDFLKKLSKY